MAGFLDFLSGAAQGVDENVQKNLEQRRKLQQLQAEAMFKQQYPSAEDQIRQRVLQLTGQAYPTPKPLGGYNPQEQAAGIPRQVDQANSQQQLRALSGFAGSNLPETDAQIRSRAQAAQEGKIAGDPMKPKLEALKRQVEEEHKRNQEAFRIAKEKVDASAKAAAQLNKNPFRALMNPAKVDTSPIDEYQSSLVNTQSSLEDDIQSLLSSSSLSDDDIKAFEQKHGVKNLSVK